MSFLSDAMMGAIRSVQGARADLCKAIDDYEKRLVDTLAKLRKSCDLRVHDGEEGGALRGLKDSRRALERGEGVNVG